MFRCHVWLPKGILALYFAKGIWWGSVPGDSLWNIGGSGRWECGYHRWSPSQPLHIWVLDCAAAIVGVNGMFRKMRHHHSCVILLPLFKLLVWTNHDKSKGRSHPSISYSFYTHMTWPIEVQAVQNCAMYNQYLSHLPFGNVAIDNPDINGGFTGKMMEVVDFTLPPLITRR